MAAKIADLSLSAYQKVRGMVQSGQIRISYRESNFSSIDKTSVSQDQGDEIIVMFPFGEVEKNFSKGCERILQAIEYSVNIDTIASSDTKEVLVIDYAESIPGVEFPWWSALCSSIELCISDPLIDVANWIEAALIEHVGIDEYVSSDFWDNLESHLSRSCETLVKQLGDPLASWKRFEEHFLCSHSSIGSETPHGTGNLIVTEDSVTAATNLVNNDLPKKLEQIHVPFIHNKLLPLTSQTYSKLLFDSQTPIELEVLNESLPSLSSYTLALIQGINNCVDNRILQGIRTCFPNLRPSIDQIELQFIECFGVKSRYPFAASGVQQGDSYFLLDLLWEQLKNGSNDKESRKLESILERISSRGLDFMAGALIGYGIEYGWVDKPTVLMWVNSGGSRSHIEIASKFTEQLKSKGYHVAIACRREEITLLEHEKNRLKDTELILLPNLASSRSPLLSDICVARLLEFNEKRSLKGIVTELWPDGHHNSNGFLMDFLSTVRREGASSPVIAQLARDVPGINKSGLAAEEVVRSLFDSVFVLGDSRSYTSLAYDSYYSDQFRRRYVGAPREMFLGYGNKSVNKTEPIGEEVVMAMLGSSFTSGNFELLCQIIKAHQYTELSDRRLYVFLNLEETPQSIIGELQGVVHEWGNDKVELLNLLSPEDYDDFLSRVKLAFTRCGYSVTQLVGRKIPIFSFPVGNSMSEQSQRLKQLEGWSSGNSITQIEPWLFEATPIEFAHFVNQRLSSVEDSRTIRSNGFKKAAYLLDVYMRNREGRFQRIVDSHANYDYSRRSLIDKVGDY